MGAKNNRPDDHRKFNYLIDAIGCLKNDLVASLDNLALEVTAEAINLNVQDVENLLKGIGGTQRTPFFTRETTSGTITAGKFKVEIFNTGTEIGTVLGTDLGPNESVTFEVRDADTLGAITYDPTTPGAGTEFVIVTIE